MSTDSPNETTALLPHPSQPPTPSRPPFRTFSSALLQDLALETAFSDINSSSFVLPSTFVTPAHTRPASLIDAAESGFSSIADHDDDGEPPLRDDLWLILTGMWCGSFLSALDSTVVASCLSAVGAEFNASNSIGWLGTSYLMSTTALQPLYGKCAQIFGRRVVCLFSSVVFLLGTLACGLSQTYPQLLAARAFTGVGGAGLAVMMSIVTSDLVPLRRRGVFQGASIGGPVGGIMSDTVGWRWAFLVQVPICFLHLGMILWKVEPSFTGEFQAVDIAAKVKRVDFGGSAILISAVFLFLFGLSLGGNELPWSAPLVWSTILAGIILVVVFLLYETFVAQEPLLFSRTPGFVSLTNWFLSMAQFSMLYTIPLYFVAVKGVNNSRAGTYLIPNVVFTSVASLGAGMWMSRTGVYKGMLVMFGVFTALSPICTIFWSRDTTPEFFFWVTMIPGGLGYGGVLTITLVALISAVEPELMPAATGTSYLFRATGSVLGISLSTAILQNALARTLPSVIKGPDAETIISRLREDISTIRTLAPELREVVTGAYASALRSVFLATAGMGILCLLAILPIQHHDLPSRLDRKK
ncbi:MFS general substrate transporter [Pseudohyphozyma bogoriensis]|nr:MFS general substrate transporter [Pseudohyphozyma bogoriensis]